MRLSGGACVLVGNLNPAILRPDWVVKHGILPDGGGSSGFGVGAAGITMRFTLAGLTWTPGPERLTVESESDDAEPGAFVARVLEKLAHTPVRAVGNNYQFSIGSGDSSPSVIQHAFLSRFAGDKQFVGASVVVKLSHDSGAVINATLDFDENSNLKDFKVNFHRGASDASAAAEAARKWRDDRAEALRLVERLVGSP